MSDFLNNGVDGDVLHWERGRQVFKHLASINVLHTSANPKIRTAGEMLDHLQTQIDAITKQVQAALAGVSEMTDSIIASSRDLAAGSRAALGEIHQETLTLAKKLQSLEVAQAEVREMAAKAQNISVTSFPNASRYSGRGSNLNVAPAILCHLRRRAEAQPATLKSTNAKTAIGEFVLYGGKLECIEDTLGRAGAKTASDSSVVTPADGYYHVEHAGESLRTGVFVNGSYVGTGHIFRLNAGDRVGVGIYVIGSVVCTEQIDLIVLKID